MLVPVNTLAKGAQSLEVINSVLRSYSVESVAYNLDLLFQGFLGSDRFCALSSQERLDYFDTYRNIRELWETVKDIRRNPSVNAEAAILEAITVLRLSEDLGAPARLKQMLKGWQQSSFATFEGLGDVQNEVNDVFFDLHRLLKTIDA